MNVFGWLEKVENFLSRQCLLCLHWCFVTDSWKINTLIKKKVDLLFGCENVYFKHMAEILNQPYFLMLFPFNHWVSNYLLVQQCFSYFYYLWFEFVTDIFPNLRPKIQKVLKAFSKKDHFNKVNHVNYLKIIGAEIIFFQVDINHWHKHGVMGRRAISGYLGPLRHCWGAFTVTTSVELSNMFAAIKPMGLAMRVVGTFAWREGGYDHVYIKFLPVFLNDLINFL